MKYLYCHHILYALQLLIVVLYLHQWTVLHWAKTRVFPTSLFSSVMQDLIWLAPPQGNVRLIKRGVVQCLFVKVGIYFSRRKCSSRRMFFFSYAFILNCLLVFVGDGEMSSLTSASSFLASVLLQRQVWLCRLWWKFLFLLLEEISNCLCTANTWLEAQETDDK